MRNEAQGKPVPVDIPLQESDRNIRLKRIGKAIKPSMEEVKTNVRARSAVLRTGEKLK